MAKPKTTLKKKKKEWYAIAAPKDLGGRIVGETFTEDPESLVGRSLRVNLSRVTGDLKKQNINVDFIISGVKEGKCETFVRKFLMQPTSIKRMVRTGVDRIDESVVLKTKDNVKVRIKPMLVTRGKVKSSVRKYLRRAMLDETRKYFEKTPYILIMQAVAAFNLQKDLKAKLTKIYPLKAVQIRSIGMEGENKKPAEAPVEKAEQKVEEKAEEKAVEKKPVKEKAEEKAVEKKLVKEKAEGKAEKPKTQEKVEKKKAKPEPKEKKKENSE
jgi:small subunit ribosomal protein S3Ae